MSVKMFEVTDSGTARGLIVRATEDMLPGVEVMREMPILWAPCTSYTVQSIEEIYSAFELLSSEDKARYLSLYGPTDNESGAVFRDIICRNWPKDSHTEDFLKALMVHRYNASACSEGSAVYLYACRMCHSCIPNCIWYDEPTRPREKVVRAIRPIKAGDELTVCYDVTFTANPTHERRAYYLATKDFLCDCERCSRSADDTRRFHCVATVENAEGIKSGCDGWHSTCQPVSTAEPYLLPCTVCLRAPSPEAQRAQFRMEEEQMSALLSGGPKSSKGWRDFGLGPRMSGSKAAQAGLTTAPLALPLHYSALGALRTKAILATMRGETGKAVRFVRQYLALVDTLLPFPSPQYFYALKDVTDKVSSRISSGESLLMSVASYRKAIRIANILRCFPMSETCVVYSALNGAVQKLLRLGTAIPTGGENCCANCEANPAEMAVELRACAGCARVLYCDGDCQEDHWQAVHKDECGGL